MATIPATASLLRSISPKPLFKAHHHRYLFPPKPTFKPPTLVPLVSSRSQSTLTPAPSSQGKGGKEELVFFDGGAHYGDLVANLLLGFTVFWLPLTLAAVSRAFFLRYRFTNRRVTVISGLTGGDRSDFPYSSVKDVQVVPRLVGEWGDIVITLKDGTKVDLRSVPRFREVADYCLLMAKDGEKAAAEGGGGARGF